MITRRHLSLCLLSAALTACADAPESTATTTDSTTTDSSDSTATATTEPTPTTTTDSTTTAPSTTTTDSTTTTAPSTTTTDSTTTAPPIDEAALADCTAVYAAEAAFATWSCQCQLDQGLITDLDACLADFIDPAGDTCACQLLAADPTQAAGLACLAGAAAQATCVTDLGCDMAAFIDCALPYIDAQASCGDLPHSAAVELQCRGADIITCGDGERIPDTFACDGVDDCADLSDETGCGLLPDTGP